MKTHVEFYNGQKMPIIGLGTRQAKDPAEIKRALSEALKAGYRHIDTAYNYLNEDSTGEVLKEWIDSGKIKRSDLFITTKLASIAMHKGRVDEFLKKSLAALRLDYVDLYLIHTPVGFQYVNDEDIFPRKDGKFLLDKTTNLEKIWKAMEEQVHAGFAKAIGVSNFNEKQVERIVKVATIKPANIQVELDVYFQQKSLRKLCKEFGITVCAYAPLGSPGRADYLKKQGRSIKDLQIIPVLDDPVVKNIGKVYGKTSGQVLLRFLAQQDIIVIPKSTNAERLKQNFDIFDFELTPAEIKELEGIDKNERIFSLNTFPGVEDHPENPF